MPIITLELISDIKFIIIFIVAISLILGISIILFINSFNNLKKHIILTSINLVFSITSSVFGVLYVLDYINSRVVFDADSLYVLVSLATLCVSLILVIINTILSYSNIKTLRIFKTALCYTKNSTFTDYFLVCNKKGKIVDSSTSIKEYIKFDKKKLNTTGIDFIFDNFNITKLNSNSLTNFNVNNLKNDIYASMRKLNVYTFDLNITKNEEVVHYIVFVKGIYNKNNKVLGSIITIYQDKMELLNILKEEIKSTVKRLSYEKNNLHALMSLSDGVILYFDEEDKMYYTTQSFKNYLTDKVSSYSFEDFLGFIHPDDLNNYFVQTKQINSSYVTRINFRFMINNVYHNACEDSMFTSSDGTGLVSVIRIIDDVEEKVISTEDVTNILRELASENVSDMISSTSKLLDHALQVFKDE